MQPFHLERIALQPNQAWLGPTCRDPAYGEVLASHESYAMVDGDEVLGCAGIVPWGPNVLAWALLSGKRLLATHKAVRTFLAMCDHRRIETWVDDGFAEGHRWAVMLGFQPEGLMRRHREDADVWLYARVKGGEA